MNTAHDITLAERFAEAINSRNLDLFDQFVSGKRYANHNPFVPDGRDAVRSFFAGQWLASFPDTHVTIKHALAVSDDRGDFVIARVAYEGTHTGAPFLGIPAQGRSVLMRSLDLWRVAEDSDGIRRFVEHWDELNLLEVMQQLGAVPAPDQTASEHSTAEGVWTS
ncbi:MAG: ester cyclase [Bacteroidota bacterium]